MLITKFLYNNKLAKRNNSIG